ncbi:MAG: tripartite tricarboxylate transporter permease [Candidatus Heteroscillospira sp.]|jgi:putative tricarboxylic transport membrane protein
MSGIDLYTAGIHLFTPTTLGFLLFGLIVGITIGALPGLNVNMAVSIMLPLTYGMDPSAGILMLLGVYCGGNYGGSIAATLVNIPGTPSAVMTTLDAYPMAQKGKAGLAIGLATMASALGGLFSCIVLATISPIVAEIALQFTSLEMTVICIFGVSIMAFVAGGSMLKGIIAGVFGLVVSCIGFDPVTAVPRFTFDSIYLFSGIQFTAAMIGLFGFTEIITSAENGLRRKVKMEIAEVHNVFECFKYLKSCGGNIMVSSVIGTIIGAIPGAGGTIASIVSYGFQKKVNKHPEELGNGAPDGIVAAEASNNACCGGAMTTLLSLGIPGDSVTAILLGAFIIHGMQPGPTLFSDNPDMVSAIFIGMFIINIALLFVGLLGAPQFAKFLKIPKHILHPCILVLCVIGTYGVQGSTFDVKMMFLFGVIGYVFSKLGIPRPPIVLGLVLGTTLEENLRRTVTLSRGDLWGFFWKRTAETPIALIVLIITVMLLFGPPILRIIKKSRAAKN